MLSDAQQFILNNNADWIQPFVLNSYDPSTNLRSSFDLTGCTLKMTIIGPSSGHPSQLISTSNGYITITNAATGAFTIHVPAPTMWNLPAATYVGDMLIFQSNGDVLLAFSCELTIEAGDTAPVYP